MNNGLTSQSRPIFSITVADPDLAEIGSVKAWCYEVTERMHAVLRLGNFHDVIPGIWEDGMVYGTAVLCVDEDEDNVLHFTQMPIGSFWIGDDSKGNVRVFYRRFPMTVRQIIQKFGVYKDGKLQTDNLSQQVQNAHMSGRLQEWVSVSQIIYPNDQYDPDALDAKFKRYASVYFETGGGDQKSVTGIGNLKGPDADKYLSESGRDYFPVLAFRLGVNGEDTYGSSCPGMLALGDAKGLQKMESKKLQAIDKKVSPPLNAPPSMRNAKISSLPSAINFVSAPQGQTLAPTYEVDFKIDELRDEIIATEQRVKDAFYVPVFLALSQDARLERPTAEEVREIRVEKFTVLGSVLERANVGVLDPLIDILFEVMNSRGMLPPPPPELEEGMPLKVEYVSILAQMQKQLAVSGTVELANFASGMVQTFPDAGDNYNVDQAFRDMAGALGVNPEQVNDEQEVRAIRDAKARAAQAEKSILAARESAAAAKDMSQASLEGDTVLSKVAGSLAGAGV